LFQLIELDNQKLEVLIRGDGEKVVVIQTGMYCSIYDWMDIIDELSKWSKVIAYHRPGYGKSSLESEIRTTKKAADELKVLLEKLEVHESIILVGHSYGGLCAQHFIKLYPHLVNSCILVDSTSVNFHRLNELELPVSDQIESDDIWVQKCKHYSKMTSDELIEEIQPSVNSRQQDYSIEIQNRIINFYVNPNLYKAVASEITNWNKCSNDIKNIEYFPNIPLIILGRDPQYSVTLQVKDGIPIEEAQAIEEVWQELIREQLTLSNEAELLIVNKASHSIHIDKADILIDKIKCFL
jgi:hypothetical protein